MDKIDTTKDSIEIKFNYINVFYSAIMFTAGSILYTSFYKTTSIILDYLFLK